MVRALLFPSCILCFPETLEVNDLAFAKETNDIVHIGVIGETENVVIGDAGFLLGGQILREIGNHIAFDLHTGGTPGETGGGSGINAGGMIDEIGGKICHAGILVGEITGQLIDHGTNHLQMAQFLSTCIVLKIAPRLCKSQGEVE